MVFLAVGRYYIYIYSGLKMYEISAHLLNWDWEIGPDQIRRAAQQSHHTQWDVGWQSEKPQCWLSY